MSYFNLPETENQFDVIICGGGLAGQTLARQLRLSFPEMTILMLEKSYFPLPVATPKVGESTVEISAFYFEKVLQLTDYFKNAHYKKLGLRYFTGKTDGSFAERPEIGLSKFPRFDSFQIDRGILENDLYRLNNHHGVRIEAGTVVQDINLQAEGLHEVKYKAKGQETVRTAQGRWVIDAMGRRCYLQNKLGLKRMPEDKFSSVWLRVRGRLDVEDFVPESNWEWHERVPFRTRYFSTNHIMGQGYWVWLIPLPSGNTSVGIVTAEKHKPFQEYNTREKAMEWLRTYEPVVAAHLEDREVLDFTWLRNYSYTTRQLFSESRWACTGEAALFPDPYYSPGSNLIGFENSMITRMIELDKKGELSAGEVARFNNFVISLNGNYDQTIHSSYSYFQHPQIISLSYLWDLVMGWSFVVPQMFNGIYLDPHKDAAIRKVTARLLPVSVRIEQLFTDWEALAVGRYTFKFIDYLSIPFVKAIYERNVRAGKSLEELIRDHEENVQDIEEFAQAIFRMAVEDVFPEKVALFSDTLEINAAAISLTPSAWLAEGLFEPAAQKPAANKIFPQIRSLYTFPQEELAHEPVKADPSFNFSF